MAWRDLALLHAEIDSEFAELAEHERFTAIDSGVAYQNQLSRMHRYRETRRKELSQKERERVARIKADPIRYAEYVSQYRERDRARAQTPERKAYQREWRRQKRAKVRAAREARAAQAQADIQTDLQTDKTGDK